MKPRAGERAELSSPPDKIIHLRIDPHDVTVSLEDVLREIAKLQRKHPDREVMFDGKEYAIVSKPKGAKTVTSKGRRRFRRA